MKSVVDPENVYCFIVGGSDYTRVSQRRTLQSGSIECVSIPIIDDTIQELTGVSGDSQHFQCSQIGKQLSQSGNCG